MHRKLKALILVVVVLAVARAQSPQQPTVSDYDPKSWKPYTSQEGAFEVSFPGAPSLATIPAAGTNVHLYSVQNSLGIFLVNYIDVPPPIEDPASANDFWKGLLSGTVQKGSVLVSEQDLSFNGVRGIEMVVNEQGSITHTRYFLVKRRLYTQAIAANPKVVFKNEKVTAIESDRTDLYREISDQFFKSFKIDIESVTKSAADSTSDLLTAAPDKDDIYPANANARQEIDDALKRASAEHRRVLLVFGANWCYDCHVLDRALHEGEAGKLVSEKYLVVHVDIGQGEKNAGLIKDYRIPLEKGVPAVAVLDADGKLLYSSGEGEFEAARRMLKKDLVKFLTRWKPL